MSDYFSVGTRLNPVVSNSSLSCINPEEGGSPKRFLNFFDIASKEKNKSFEKGTLLHQYMENKSAFIVSDVTKPSDMMAEWVENIHALVKGSALIDMLVDTTIDSKLKGDNAKLAHIVKIQDEYNNVATTLGIPADMVVRIVRQARGTRYKSYTNEDVALQLLLSEGKDYYKHLKEANGKIVISRDVKESLEGAIKSIEYNKEIQAFFARPFDEDVLVFRELEIYFDEVIYLTINGELLPVSIPCKVKIDYLSINKTTGVVKYADTKTTSKSIYLFKNSFVQYKYHRQHSFYNKGIKAFLLQQGYSPSDFKYQHYNIVVEMQDLYLSCIYRVGGSYLAIGNQEVQSLLTRVAWHLQSNKWDKSIEEYTDGMLVLEADIQ